MRMVRRRTGMLGVCAWRRSHSSCCSRRSSAPRLKIYAGRGGVFSRSSTQTWRASSAPSAPVGRGGGGVGGGRDEAGGGVGAEAVRIGQYGRSGGGRLGPVDAPAQKGGRRGRRSARRRSEDAEVISGLAGRPLSGSQQP